MTNYQTHFSFNITVGDARAIADRIADAAEAWEGEVQPKGNPLWGLEDPSNGMPGIEAESDTVLWFYSDAGESNIDLTLNIVAWVLDQPGAEPVVRVQWANTSSRPVIDGFGGGAAVVNKLGWTAQHTGSLVVKLAEPIDEVEYEVTMKILVNHTVYAANPEFTASDAKETAFQRLTDALEQAEPFDVELMEATAVQA